jgi:hypothetical protein
MLIRIAPVTRGLVALLRCSALAWMLAVALPPSAVLAQDVDPKIQEMLQQLDKLDRLDFLDELEKAERCTVSRNFKCAEDSLNKARRYANGESDRALMARARSAIEREAARMREEEAERQAEIEEEQRAQRREERREACIDKCPVPSELQACLRGHKHPDHCDDGEPPPPSTGEVILGAFNKTMESHARMTQIHNEAMQNFAVIQQERQRQAQVIIDNENAQRRQRQADAQEAREARQQRDRARERERERERERQQNDARERDRARQAAASPSSVTGYRPGTVIQQVEPPKPVVVNLPAPCVLGAASERHMDRNQLGSGCLNGAGAKAPSQPSQAPTRIAANTPQVTFANSTTGGGAPERMPGTAPANPAPVPKKVKWGPVLEELLAICRQSEKTSMWVCYGGLDNQSIVDEPSLESALARQRCAGGSWAAGGPTIKGQQWEAYRCGHAMDAGDYDVGKRYNMITARRKYICPENQIRRCDTPYDGQDRRD